MSSDEYRLTGQLRKGKENAKSDKTSNKQKQSKATGRDGEGEGDGRGTQQHLENGQMRHTRACNQERLSEGLPRQSDRGSFARRGVRGGEEGTGRCEGEETEGGRDVIGRANKRTLFVHRVALIGTAFMLSAGMGVEKDLRGGVGCCCCMAGMGRANAWLVPPTLNCGKLVDCIGNDE